VKKKISTVCKRLQKYIREKPANFDIVDFKFTVKQVDKSENFFLQSTQLTEISNEEMEKEVDLSL
jgi:hypothetical protein